MINKAKALSLAFVAVAAMSAAAASAAQAGSFDVGAQPAVITAHTDPGTEHFISFPLTAGGTISAICPTASYEGTTQGQTDITELTVTATYGSPECKVNGLNAIVRMNGCKYTITNTGAVRTSVVDIVGCTSGKQIEIEQTGTGCIMTIPEQNGLSHITFTQINPQQVTDNFTVTGITFTESAKCPNPNHHGANASFTGNTIVTARTDEPPVQVTKHGHQYSEFRHGAQVSLTAT